MFVKCFGDIPTTNSMDSRETSLSDYNNALTFLLGIWEEKDIFYKPRTIWVLLTFIGSLVTRRGEARANKTKKLMLPSKPDHQPPFHLKTKEKPREGQNVSFSHHWFLGAREGGWGGICEACKSFVGLVIRPVDRFPLILTINIFTVWKHLVLFLMLTDVPY